MGLRIVGGELSRRRIDAPPGKDVRPTTDRVRESLFSVLGERVYGARVLDLFAGTGVLGIESLSRGAREAVFVERDARTARILGQNLESLTLSERSRVLLMPAQRALRALAREPKPFNLVFLDPPYDSPLLSWALSALSGGSLLAEDGLVVAERPAGGELPALDRLECVDERGYGTTMVTLLQLREPPRSVDPDGGSTPPS